MRTDIDRQERERYNTLGAENARFCPDPLSEFTGSVVQGLVITSHRFQSFRAVFPYYKERVDISIDTPLILMRERLVAIGIGRTLRADTTQYQNDPRVFAAAINQAVRPGIQVNWSFFTRSLPPAPDTPATQGTRVVQTMNVYTAQDLHLAMDQLRLQGFTQRNPQLDVSDQHTASIFLVNARQEVSRIDYRDGLDLLTWEMYFRENPTQPWQPANEKYDAFNPSRSSAQKLSALQIHYGAKNVKLVYSPQR